MIIGIQQTISKLLIVMMLGQVFFVPSIYAQDSDKNAKRALASSVSAKSTSSISNSSTGLSIPDEVKQISGTQEINPANGQMSFVRTDLKLPGRNGLDVVINRSYSSGNYNSKAGTSINSVEYDGPIHTISGPDGLPGEGAGMTVADLNNNGKGDAVFYYIVDSSGENSSYYQIGWDLDSTGKPARLSETIKTPGSRAKTTNGGGISVGDINQDGKKDRPSKNSRPQALAIRT